MSEKNRPTDERLPKGTRVTDNAQATINEAQQTPANSGDPRTSNAVGVPLPYGGPSDNLHPITQPRGDAEDPESDRMIHRDEKEKRSA